MVPQSLHVPLLPAASSLIRISRPHFGQANLMVMARDLWDCTRLEIGSLFQHESVATKNQEFGDGKVANCPAASQYWMCPRRERLCALADKDLA
jgi:hypothetical protein